MDRKLTNLKHASDTLTYKNGEYNRSCDNRTKCNVIIYRI